MSTPSDSQLICSAQLASLVALPVWYPWYRATTLAKQEILLSCKPNNMTHLVNFCGWGNFKSLNGILTYYKGFVPTLCFQPVYPAVIYEKTFLNRKLFDGKPTIYQDCMLSVGVGASTAFVATPLNVVLTQVFRDKDTKPTQIIKSFYNQYGITRFFSGLKPFILRNSLFCTGLTVVYPNTQKYVAEKYPNVAYYKSDILFSGIVSAIICSGMVDFFDIIGVMRQSHQYKDKSSLKLLQEVYLKHGTRGLFVGFTPKIMQVMSEIIVFNETFKYFIKNV
jgi:hypothetical protein